MKELLLSLVAQQPDPLRKRSIAREYLQARILLALQDAGAFSNWAFVGGTALRFLFQLPRYSEDLDFSLSEPGGETRFLARMRAVKNDLAAETYDVEIKAREGAAVAAAFIKFKGLLFEMGISPHASEVLSVKVEIDANPPAGAVLDTRTTRRFVLLNLLHHDRASLFAGKLHAVLSRRYTKGRDLYDLAWYLSDPTWPEPNFVLLDNALKQTGGRGEIPRADNWKNLIRKRLDPVNWDRARDDVAPFLERPQDRDLISAQVFKRLLSAPGRGVNNSRA
jgi:predicted nucleotidyltransferase component of viral defense system